MDVNRFDNFLTEQVTAHEEFLERSTRDFLNQQAVEFFKKEGLTIQQVVADMFVDLQAIRAQLDRFLMNEEERGACHE